MTLRMPTYVLVMAFLASGCATLRVGADEQRAAMGVNEVIVNRIAYDAKGLPHWDDPLESRPGKPGDRFVIARLANGRLETTYDVAVVGREPDFARPFKAIYEWTGKGFRWGAEGTARTLDAMSGANPKSKEEFVALLVIAATPLAAGTAGGFVVGVADGIRCTAQELAKIVVNVQERVATFTTYAYDARDRLVLMRMYTAGERKELVRTEFTYEDDSPVPLKTTVTSIPEGIVRTLEY